MSAVHWKDDRLRLTRVLGDGAMFCWKHCAFRWLVLALEVIADLFHLNPLDAWLGADVLD